MSLFKSRLSLAASSLLVAASGMAQDNVLKGQGKAGDWQSDAPGVQHRITVSDLPPDYATPSAHNTPKVVAAPKGAKPRVPQGFDVAHFADGFTDPRYLLTAANGDIFLTESSANTIRRHSDTETDDAVRIGNIEEHGVWPGGIKRETEWLRQAGRKFLIDIGLSDRISLSLGSSLVMRTSLAKSSPP